MTEVTIPHLFKPRPYQVPLLKAFDNGVTRGVCVWHRRAGKDKTVFAAIVLKKMLQRKGIYYYFFPTFTQGKKDLWEAIDNDGMRFLDHIPKEILKSKPNNSELKFELVNGSIFRIIGTDDYHAIRGSNPVGCVFSEFSQQNPGAWNEVVRPVLSANGGWAIFVFTPKGKNHAWELYKLVRNDPDWFVSVQTVDDTVDEKGSPVITLEAIEKERRSGMTDDAILQEYWCSFEGAIEGGYYTRQIREVRAEGRIGPLPHERGFPVHTYWDIGVGDSTAIWFSQNIGRMRHFIDYYETSGEGIQHFAQVLQEKQAKYGYVYGVHNAPHDIRNRDFSAAGKTRREVARELGIDFNVITNSALESKDVVAEGIDAARRVFNRCRFDEEKCRRGIDCLENYRKQWDTDLQVFKERPLHDWASHGADAFRVFALGQGMVDIGEQTKELVGASKRTDFDPFANM